MVESSNDQLSLVIQYAKVIFREIYRHKLKVAIGFAIISVCVLGMGFVAPKSYTTAATLYADRTNIIRPLLSGQTAVTGVQDQTRVVKETIYSPRVMNKVVGRAGLLSGQETPAEIERKTNELRDAIKVKGIGGSYIKVTYSSSDPDKTFNVLREVLDVFVKESSESKRSESRQAYEFINSQVESYKEQLQTAEEKLRAFKAASVDGTEATVNARIGQLRNTAELLELDIEGVKTKITGFEQELGKESQFVAQQNKVGVYRNSLVRVQQQLDALLLSYTKTHPDVVALQYQIDDLKKSIKEASETKSDTQEVSVNPLYEELRAVLSEAKVELATKTQRLASTQKLLDEEHLRLKRVAENQAELSELTRDYDVTRQIYEDMLARKEKARLSMTLDIEGRGLNYKIQEPPAYPLNPTGMRFLHFMMIGPLAGLFIPIGILIALIIVDPRIRFARVLAKFEDVELLGEVGHTSTLFRNRIFKSDFIVIVAIFFAVLAVYGVAAYLKMMG